MEILEHSDLSSDSKTGYSRILITGVGKSGSTALFFNILNSMPEETVNLFEPETTKKTLPEDVNPPVLVKSFIPYSENFSFFEKKVLIIRDPRDNLLSLLLYKPYNIIAKEFPGEKEKAFELVNSYVELIRQKENEPGRVNVRDLYERLEVFPQKRMDLISDYYERYPEVKLLKYEDFIDNRLASLEDYLQFKLKAREDIPSRFQRVARTKNYGNWRSWFTPADVEFFKPMMKDFLARFGYEDEWKLESNPGLDPELGSLYVEKIINEASALRKKKNLG